MQLGKAMWDPLVEKVQGTSSGKSDPARGLQIVGMSATLPNVAAVADWLQVSINQVWQDASTNLYAIQIDSKFSDISDWSFEKLLVN